MPGTSPKVIMIMIDGFGVPPEGWLKSVYSKFCDREFIETFMHFSRPIDARLGVEGLPQSATGQTSLFTGVNAAREIGMHMQGFPGPSLRRKIAKTNIFSELMRKGKSVSFANAYIRFNLEELALRKLCSVTTVMLESSLGWARNVEHMLTGKAVYHDLTRKTLSHLVDIPEISPETAAENLFDISAENDFTLFEYFLTDRAGHKRDMTMLETILKDLSAFICRISKLLNENTFLLVTGDHGNCEDPETRTHTLNPVPLLVLSGNGSYPADKLPSSIGGVYRFITEDLLG